MILTWTIWRFSWHFWWWLFLNLQTNKIQANSFIMYTIIGVRLTVNSFRTTSNIWISNAFSYCRSLILLLSLLSWTGVWASIFIHFINKFFSTHLKSLFEDSDTYQESLLSTNQSLIMILQLRSNCTTLEYNLSIVSQEEKQLIFCLWWVNFLNGHLWMKLYQ
jgi:hypothetical protein